MSGLSVGRWSTIVGYNLIDDRANLSALVALAEKFTALEADVTHSPSYVAHGPLYVLWLAAGAPLLAAWKHFYATQSDSYAERRFLTAETLASWQRRLDEVRGATDRAIATLQAPPRVAPPSPVVAPPAIQPIPAPAPPSPLPPIKEPSKLPRVLIAGGVAAGVLALIALAAKK